MSGGVSKIPGWQDVKKRWFKRYPPDENGNYECAICHQPVHIDKVSLDHIATVELYPEYAKELSNLRPTHEFCNQERAYSKVNQLQRRRILGINKPRRRK